MCWGCEVVRGLRRLSGGEGQSREERGRLVARERVAGREGGWYGARCWRLVGRSVRLGQCAGSVAVVCGVVVCCACVPRCPSCAPERLLGAWYGVLGSVEGVRAASEG